MRTCFTRKRLAAVLLCIAFFLTGVAIAPRPAIADPGDFSGSGDYGGDYGGDGDFDGDRSSGSQEAEPQKKNTRIVVSLGDSFASGEGNEPFYGQEIKKIRDRMQNKQAWEDWLAHRSTLAWSGQLYINDESTGRCVPMVRGENWFFVAASGAKTKNIVRTGYNADPYKRSHPGEQEKTFDRDGVSGTYYLPGQLNIFDGTLFDPNDVAYVTVSIGGNDVGFVEVLTLAASNTWLSTELYDNINYKLNHFYDQHGVHDDILDAYLRIHDCAPNATIIVTGYPQLLYRGVSTHSVLFDPNECDYIDRAVTEFNHRLELLVKECRDLYNVDIVFCPVEDAFKGHEAYTPFSDDFLHPIKFGRRSQDLLERINIRKKDIISSYSMHPNKDGLQVYTSCVQDVINVLEAQRIGAQQTTSPIPQTPLPTQDKSWSDAYYRCIRDAEYKDLTPNQFYNDPPCQFNLYDMNADGIPELFVFIEDEDLTIDRCIVYSYVNDSVKNVGVFGCDRVGQSGLYYAGGSRYPGLLHDEQNTAAFTWTNYYYIQERYNWVQWIEVHRLWFDVERTTSDSELLALYEQYKAGRLEQLEIYPYDAIMSMGWDAFVDAAMSRCSREGRETADAERFWSAIEASGILGFLSMNYNNVCSEAGVLDYVYAAPDEFMYYNFVFRNMPGYTFSFSADLSEADGWNDRLELTARDAERYVALSDRCTGVGVYALSELGFTGSVRANEINATVGSFMDDDDLRVASVVRNGRQYYFFCEADGTINGNSPCWVFSRWD